MKKNKRMKTEEILYCQLENINVVQNLLQVMKVQKKLLQELMEQTGKKKTKKSGKRSLAAS